MTRQRPLPRSFRLLLASQGISLLGSEMQLIALPLWVYRSTGSPLSTGLAFAVQFIPIVLLAPWVGHIADRFERRRLMIVCELAAATVVVIVLIGVRIDSVLLVLMFAALTRVFNAITMPAMQAVIVGTVPHEDRPRSASQSTIVFAAVQMVAPLAGTALAAGFGFEFVLVIDLVSFVVSAGLLLGLRRCPGEPGLRYAARSTVLALREHATPLLRWVVGAEAAFFLLWGADAALVLLILQDEYGPAVAGLYATAAGVGWVVGSAIVAQRFAAHPLVLLAAGPLSSPLAAVGLVALVPFGPVAAFPPGVLAGVGNLAVVTGATTVFQQEAPAAAAGRLFAIRRAVLNASLGASYLLLPGVSQAGLGHRGTLVLFSVLTCLAVLPLARVAAGRTSTPDAVPV